MRTDQIVRFLGLLRGKDCPSLYCGRSPRCRSFKKRFPGNKKQLFRNHEFVTVKIQGLFLTCLHLDAKSETLRLEKLQGILTELLKVWNEPHIWAGDFNSVTRGDYPDDKWTKLEEERTRLPSDNSDYDDEPKAEVADGRAELLRLLGEDGMKGTVTTCR